MKMRLTSLAAVFLTLFGFRAPASVLYVDLNSTSPAPPFADRSTAAVSIQDAVDAATNGDLILVNDGVYQDGFGMSKEPVGTGIQLKTLSVTNRIAVNKALTVQSINGSSSAFISGSAIYRCAYLTNGAVLSGFTLINGTAGWLSTTQSFHGSVTVTNAINGGGVAGANYYGSSPAWVSNCVLTANVAYGNGGGAAGVNMVNCTLTGNTATSGGGVFESVLLNCVVTGNGAQTSQNPSNPFYSSTQSGVGGGLYGGSAFNCLIANNAAFEGGGAYGVSKMVNCTIANNSAAYSGGVGVYNSSPYGSSALMNCLLYFNTAGTNANYDTSNVSLDHCCTVPLPASGMGNITNDPNGVNGAGGDFHLQANSPCINSGNNSAITNTTDLDGNPRLAGGTVDIGAYEFPSPASIISYAWLQQFGFPTDGTADFADPDGDDLNNWQEFIAGTNPTNAASFLTVTSIHPVVSQNRAVIQWQSVNTRTYYLQRAADLTAQPAFTSIQSNLVGQTGNTSYIDTTATNGGPYFYRVGVQ